MGIASSTRVASRVRRLLPDTCRILRWTSGGRDIAGFAEASYTPDADTTICRLVGGVGRLQEPDLDTGEEAVQRGVVHLPSGTVIHARDKIRILSQRGSDLVEPLDVHVIGEPSDMGHSVTANVRIQPRVLPT